MSARADHVKVGYGQFYGRGQVFHGRKETRIRSIHWGQCPAVGGGQQPFGMGLVSVADSSLRGLAARYQPGVWGQYRFGTPVYVL